MIQHHAFESKFIKFYIIRIIQICEQKTLKAGFKEIRVYSNKQSTIKKYQNRKSKEEVYEGETYISTKQYLTILAQFPKVTQKINLSDHFKKKMGSQPLIQATVKEKVSYIIEKKRQEEQEIRTKQVIQNFLKHRSIRGVEQITKNNPAIIIKNSQTNNQLTYFIATVIVIFFLYKASRCEQFLL